MKKLIAAGLLAAAALAGAGTAHADTDPMKGDHNPTTYAQEVMGGFPEATGLPAMAARTGAAVCKARADGLSEDRLIKLTGSDPEIIAKLMPKYSDPMLPGMFAVTLIMNAEWHFCPEYATAFNEAHAELG